MMMKRYMVCLLLFFGVSAACLATGAAVTRHYRHDMSQEASQAVEREVQAKLEREPETEPKRVEAANQEKVAHETAKVQEEYYLVCEDGFLLVFLKDQKTICLYTHIPIADFPAKEQERLREGIGFSNMMEVFNYLESYTS